jgi:amino acid transporter
MTTSTPQVFIRNATGLVREMSPTDGAIFNILNAAAFTTAIFMFAQAPVAFPGANIAIGILITAVLGIFHTLNYAWLNSLMPRSGADYVYQSRILHPAIGFVLIFTGWTLWGTFWMSFYGWATAVLGVSPSAVLIGVQTHTTALSSFGSWAASKPGIVVISFVALAIAWYVVSQGMRLYVRAQWVIITGMAISALLVWGLLAGMDQASFIAKFNAFMTGFSSKPDYYHYVISQAAKEGYGESSGINWGATLGISALVWISLSWAWFSATVGGEIRRANDWKTSSWMMLAPLWVAAIWLAGTGFFLEKAMGATFVHSISYMAFSASPSLGEMPTTPYFYFLVGLATSNPLLTLLLFLGVTLSAASALFFSAMAATRVWLAATFDSKPRPWIVSAKVPCT